MEKLTDNRINEILDSMSKEELLILIEYFEYYPAVTIEDDKYYIIAYLNDEACSISKYELSKYLTNKEKD